MKQGKRKLHLDRTTIRPLNPQRLAQVAGGTGLNASRDLACEDPTEDTGSLGSMTQNYSKDQNQMCAGI